MEKALITAVTHDVSEAMLRIIRAPDKPGVAARIFGALAAESINIDMIVQNLSEGGKTDVSFTMPKDDLARSHEIVKKIADDVGAEGYSADEDIAKLSLIGAGMKSHPGVAAKMFQALADAEINMEMISTSSIRISCVIRASEVERAVNVLHESFDLPGGAAAREEHL